MSRKWPLAVEDLRRRWPKHDRPWRGRLLDLVERTAPNIKDSDLVSAIAHATGERQFSAGLYERTLPPVLENWKALGFIEYCPECSGRFSQGIGAVMRDGHAIECPTCAARISSNNSEVQSGKDRPES
jgi:hypothetical protein